MFAPILEYLHVCTYTCTHATEIYILIYLIEHNMTLSQKKNEQIVSLKLPLLSVDICVDYLFGQRLVNIRKICRHPRICYILLPALLIITVTHMQS